MPSRRALSLSAMRSLVAFLGSVALLACDSGSASTSNGASDDASADGGGADAADASPNDATASDAGGCGGPYDKTCLTADDCLMVALGCYCGAQPIIGVAKSAQPAAQACETDAGATCTRGCANAPGHVAEDGQNDEGTGRNLEVLCDAGMCHTVLGP